MMVLVTGGLLFLLRKKTVQVCERSSFLGSLSSRCRRSSAGGELDLRAALTACVPGRRPRALVALLIMFERRRKTCQHFGGGFEHGLELGLVHFGDILPKVMNRLFQALAHFARMVDRVGLTGLT